MTESTAPTIPVVPDSLFSGSTIALLTKVMHQQKRDIKLVCQLLHLTDFIVVVTVRGIHTAVTHDLKSIDCNENGIGMLLHNA